MPKIEMTQWNCGYEKYHIWDAMMSKITDDDFWGFNIYVKAKDPVSNLWSSIYKIKIFNPLRKKILIE